MSRSIDLHKQGGLNDLIEIEVLDRPGPGGASTQFRISAPPADGTLDKPEWIDKIVFHSGPIDKGPVGVTNEAILAVLIDRLQGFQAGPFPCRENAEALSYLRAALQALQKRTAERIERKVEGLPVV